MAVADDRPSDSHDLESREPTLEDLRDLCRELNLRGARYVVIGGFAVRAAGYNRRTMDVDLMVAADSENERLVFEALSTLPDNAVRELQPGELQQYAVIRVAASRAVALSTSTTAPMAGSAGPLPCRGGMPPPHSLGRGSEQECVTTEVTVFRDEKKTCVANSQTAWSSPSESPIERTWATSG
jgi:hypothetical protein